MLSLNHSSVSIYLSREPNTYTIMYYKLLARTPNGKTRPEPWEKLRMGSVAIVILYLGGMGGGLCSGCLLGRAREGRGSGHQNDQARTIKLWE